MSKCVRATAKLLYAFVDVASILLSTWQKSATGTGAGTVRQQ